MAKFKRNCFWPWYNNEARFQRANDGGFGKPSRTICARLWRDYLTPSRNRRSGYTDERLRHHRTYGGASDSQLRWCDDTRSEVVGQLAGCKDALHHVVSAPNPAGSERGLAASMPVISFCVHQEKAALVYQVHLCS